VACLQGEQPAAIFYALGRPTPYASAEKDGEAEKKPGRMIAPSRIEQTAAGLVPPRLKVGIFRQNEIIKIYNKNTKILLQVCCHYVT
jgi:hypothetical protein